ncbi:MAG: transcriptional regulator [Halobacteriovoraceae bacterium]|nr:transcriptional regulator [Halobacteriovoraceae bacterium]|tara:strand:- start:87962 stop:88249 length:288 start_codon:yes stop_codon:yes gene_type:complete
MSEELIIENINTPKVMGVAVRRLRKRAGLSQLQVAELVNIRQATISDLENGRGTLDSLFKVIQALKLNLAISNKTALNSDKEKTRTNEVLNLLKD